MNPPFRADHVGSLLRPRELRHAFGEFSAGKINAREFEAVQDRAIRDAVALQERVGLDSITDGEFRRASYWSHFIDAIDGLAVRESLFQFRGGDGSVQNFTAPHVERRISRKYGAGAAAFRFLRRATTRIPKVTMPSPSTMHFWRGPQAIEAGAYGSVDEFFADLGRVYREEVAELAALGATWIQFDEVALATLCDPDIRESVERRGEDPNHLITLYIGAINAALEARPPNLRAAMHLCRGNYKGRWLSQGGYDPVAERLFNETAVDAFLLEYDTERAGDFAPLRFVPRGKIAVLGLVTTKSPTLEDKDHLKRRIDAAARILPLDQLAMCTQCGFASTIGGNPITEADGERKLKLIVEVASEVWR
ncbi:MAG: 5-methyltetrahydropteroyltriglutamate--homocysteine S-methyltransferase [Candidatus Binataceae bacterium]